MVCRALVGRIVNPSYNQWHAAGPRRWAARNHVGRLSIRPTQTMGSRGPSSGGPRHLSRRVASVGGAWGGARSGLTRLKSRSRKDRFCYAQADVGATFPPVVKGGPGGVGREPRHRQCICPFARNDVRKRHTSRGGAVAVNVIVRSHQTWRLCALDADRPTPPGPPFTRGGRRGLTRGRSAALAGWA